MQTVSTLVSVGWVAKQINSNAKKIRVVDASWHPLVAKRDPLQEYRQKHIPGALFFDVSKCSTPPEAPYYLSHTLPDPDRFADYVGKLGIDNDTHVVLYENNATLGVFSAPRVWYMFRVFGHNKVSIMEGGIHLWAKEGRETTDVIPKVDPVEFRACYLPSLNKSFSDIEANLEAKTFRVMDARPEGMFKGEIAGPREGIESGHMPNSVCVPFPTMLHKEDGISKFKSPDGLKEVFADKGLDISQPIVATCGSGISGSILAMAAYLAGKEDVAVFIGGWEEFYLKIKDKKPEAILKG